MRELLQETRIGISLGFRFPLAARRYVRCAHMELQFLRNLGASCEPCVFPVASRFATGTPALPRYAPRSVTILMYNVMDANRKQTKKMTRRHMANELTQTNELRAT